MNSLKQLRDIIDQTVVVRFPRHRLATFGDTEIQYHLVTPHAQGSSRAVLRVGRVKAARPKILTPDALHQHFEGFGEESAGFERLLKDYFADNFHSLQYVFQNQPDAVTDHHQDPRLLAKTIARDLDERDQPRDAVIRGPANGWQLSLMKFMMEETGKSFPVNLQELDERGLFDPAQRAVSRAKREVEGLFREAARNPAAVKALGAKLKEHGLFEEYQDRFFSLIPR